MLGGTETYNIVCSVLDGPDKKTLSLITSGADLNDPSKPAFWWALSYLVVKVP